MHRIPAALSARLFAAAVLSAGLFVVTPPPARAQSLIAPAGQTRVTAPGGLRGRAALRHHRARHRVMRRRHR